MRVVAKNREKFTKTPYFFGGEAGERGGSRSFKVIDVDVFEKLVASDTISSMSVPICNHFHVRRANNGRIAPFQGVPLFHPSLVKTPFTGGMKFCHKILEALSYHTVINRTSYLIWS